MLLPILEWLVGGKQMSNRPAARRRLRRLLPERSGERARRRRRASFFEEARTLTPYVAVEAGDELFIVSTHDPGVGRKVFVTNTRGDVGVVAEALRMLGDLGVDLPPEPVFVDVGANIGTTTVVALRRHGFSRAVAIEPSPETLRVLRMNVVANQLEERVQILPVAASDQPGEVTLDVSKPSWGRHRIMSRFRRPKSTVAVEAVKLDQLVADGTIDADEIGLLWIDAPFHDANVLTGATRLLAEGVPVVTTIRVTGTSRDRHRPWRVRSETKSLVLDLLTHHYTDVAVLSSRPSEDQEIHSIDDLPTIVDSFQRDESLLVVRR